MSGPESFDQNHTIDKEILKGLLEKGLNLLQDLSISIIDLNGQIQSWNLGANKIKQYSEGEILGKHFSVFYTQEDRDSFTPQREFDLAVQHGQFETEGWRVRKDGERFWAHVLMTALRDEKGRIFAFTNMIREISAFKKLSEVEESIRIRDEFISVASHELRTPVTRILLHLQHIRKTGEDFKERTIKSLETCESATKELISLMDNLVDVTKLRLGKLEIKRTKTNISSVLLNVLNKFKDPIRLFGNHVSLDHQGDLVGYWDQERLDQLFTNLLSNALKFGEGRPIKMVLKQETANISFIISDEGPGIPYELQPKVFERFERAVGSSNISGLGLGLYIARQIVVAHKGDISLESHPGKGSVFKIILPLKQAAKI